MTLTLVDILDTAFKDVKCLKWPAIILCVVYICASRFCFNINYNYNTGPAAENEDEGSDTKRSIPVTTSNSLHTVAVVKKDGTRTVADVRGLKMGAKQVEGKRGNDKSKDDKSEDDKSEDDKSEDDKSEDDKREDDKREDDENGDDTGKEEVTPEMSTADEQSMRTAQTSSTRKSAKSGGGKDVPRDH